MSSYFFIPALCVVFTDLYAYINVMLTQAKRLPERGIRGVNGYSRQVVLPPSFFATRYATCAISAANSVNKSVYTIRKIGYG